MRALVLVRRGDLPSARARLLGGALHSITEVDVLVALGDIDAELGDRDSAHEHRTRALEVAAGYDVRSMREKEALVRRAVEIAAEST